MTITDIAIWTSEWAMKEYSTLPKVLERDYYN